MVFSLFVGLTGQYFLTSKTPSVGVWPLSMYFTLGWVFRFSGLLAK